MKKILFFILMIISSITSITSAQCAAGTSAPSSTSSYTQPDTLCTAGYDSSWPILSNNKRTWTCRITESDINNASFFSCSSNQPWSSPQFEPSNYVYFRCRNPYTYRGNSYENILVYNWPTYSCETLRRIDGACNLSPTFTQTYDVYPFNPLTPSFTNGCTSGTQGAITNIGGYWTYACNGINGWTTATCWSPNYTLLARSCNAVSIPNNSSNISFAINNVPSRNFSWFDCSISNPNIGNQISSDSCFSSQGCHFRCSNGYNYNSGTKNCQTNTCAGILPTGPIWSVVSSSTPPLTLTTNWTGWNGTDACTYKCADGYSLSWGQCVAHICTGSVPSSNVLTSPTLPLINNTLWSTGNGITACTYACNNGYFLSGNACMRFDCSGTYPQLFSIFSLTPPIINNTPWNLGNGTDACTYKCQEGYLFNGSQCVLPSCDMTSLPQWSGTKLKIIANSSNGINLAFVKDRSVCGYSCMPGWEGSTCQTFSATSSKDINLTLDLKSTLTTVKVWDTITITLNYRNQGTESANNVILIFTGGSGLTKLSSSIESSRILNSLIFDLGTLPAGTNKNILITAAVGNMSNNYWIINNVSITSTNTDTITNASLTLQRNSSSSTNTFNSAPLVNNSINILQTLLDSYKTTKTNLNTLKTLPSDISDSPYLSSIQTLMNYGVMNGYRLTSWKTVFNPKKSLTYCERNTIIDRMMSISDGPASSINNSSCNNKTLKNKIISQSQAQNILINRTATTHSAAEIEDLFDAGEDLTREQAADILINTFRREKSLVIGKNDEFIQNTLTNLSNRSASSQRAFLIKLMQKFINMDAEALSKMWLDKKSLLGAIVDALKGEITDRTNKNSN